MSEPAETDKKQIIYKQLSVIIYKMADEQLVGLLSLLSELGISGDNQLLEINKLNPEELSFPRDRQLLIAHLFVLIKQLSYDELAVFLNHFEKEQFNVLRQYPRIPCNLNVDFAVKGRFVSCFARDISASGIFVETREKVSKDQEVVLCFTLSEDEIPLKIKGRVVRIGTGGIGIRYEKLDNDQRQTLSTMIEKMKGENEDEKQVDRTRSEKGSDGLS